MAGPMEGDWSGLRDQISPQELKKHVESIYQWARYPGSSGEREAAAYLKECLDGYGVDAKIEHYDSYVSDTVYGMLTILAGDRRAFQGITHPFSRSAPEGVTAEAIYVGTAKPGEISVAGKVVLVDDTDASRNVNPWANAGAVAMVCHSRGRVLQDYIISRVWGTPEPETVANLPAIPVITVDLETGDHLKALMRDGPVRVTVRTKLDTEIRHVQFPWAEVKGDPNNPDFVMLAGHMDSWYFGAQDNAVGNASLLEVARVLQQNRDKLKRNVRFCWWVGHSHGRFAASTWYCDNYYEEVSRHCVGHLNVDQPGFKDASFLKCFATPETARYLSGMVKYFTNQDVCPPRPPRLADQSFWQLGLPSFSYLPRLRENAPDEAPDDLGSHKPWYQHSPCDTLDKIDFDLLPEQTYYFASTMADLSARKQLPWDHADTADAFIKRLSELNLAGGSHLDLSPCLREADALKMVGMEVRSLEDLPPQQAERVNRALLRGSQLLLNVYMTEEGKYHPAPAAQMPLLPGLAEIGQLPKMSATSEPYIFLKIKLLRERNRVTESLRWAAEGLQKALAGL